MRLKKMAYLALLMPNITFAASAIDYPSPPSNTIWGYTTSTIRNIVGSKSNEQKILFAVAAGDTPPCTAATGTNTNLCLAYFDLHGSQDLSTQIGQYEGSFDILDTNSNGLWEVNVQYPMQVNIDCSVAATSNSCLVTGSIKIPKQGTVPFKGNLYTGNVNSTYADGTPVLTNIGQPADKLSIQFNVSQ